jgi:hypothetical protein
MTRRENPPKHSSTITNTRRAKRATQCNVRLSIPSAPNQPDERADRPSRRRWGRQRQGRGQRGDEGAD